ncbi:MAG: hypothetical protein FD180_165 [Planctomycetota bacterium]|nr:MAG: hypothetical protein FD180_165 [Planctomycetota bacterium]
MTPRRGNPSMSNGRSVGIDSDVGAGKYAAAVRASLRSAASGRNNALVSAAYGLGRLVGAGRLERVRAEEDLLAVAAEIGLLEGTEVMKSRGTIKRGLDAGEKHPLGSHPSAFGVAFRPRSGRASPPRSASHKEPDPLRPPADEVAELWQSGIAVTEDPATVAWLRSRKLSAADVVDRDLARVIKPKGPRFTWASIGTRSWADSGFRLLLPAFDATGLLATIRARQVITSDGLKEVSAQGFAAIRTVYADKLGRRLLFDGLPPSGFSADRLSVVVAEGWPDFATLASYFSDADENATAVFGIYAGGWTQDIASRIPPAATVAIWTDPDEAGHGYAERIASSLAGRCRVIRSRKEVHDVPTD